MVRDQEVNREHAAVPESVKTSFAAVPALAVVAAVGEEVDKAEIPCPDPRSA